MITLTQGLSDISKELGEATTNQDTRRIQHYNDAVEHFANERKWSFLVKEDTSLDTGDGSSLIDISSLSDIRMPGGIKEITIDGYSDPFLPVFWEDRHLAKYSNRNFFYITPDEKYIGFTQDLDANQTLDIWYYYIPSRIEDTSSSDTFPIPARYRKALGVLGAAFVQWSRYLDVPGNRLLNFYQRLIETIEDNQSEVNSGTPRRLPHYLQWRGGIRRR